MRGDLLARSFIVLPKIFWASLLSWLVLAGVYRACFIWLTPMREEVSLLHYVAWLVDQRNYVPYRDVFETSFPGAFAFHVMIGRLFGYGDTAFHVFDWLWLTILLWITWRILNVFSARTAWVGAATFFALYFAQGSAMTLQRDYVGILLLALSLLLALRWQFSLRWRSVIIGFLLALAMWIKPHLLIALPVIVWMLLYPVELSAAFSVRDRVTAVFCGMAGAFFASAVILLWLYMSGGFVPFLHMVLDYLPVYMSDDGIRSAMWLYVHIDPLSPWIDRYIPSDLGGQNPVSAGWIWQLANITGHLLEHFFAWVLLIVAGIWRGFSLTQPKTQQRQLVVALLLLCLLFWLYPVLANKYWNYHWMPYRYFAVLCGSLLVLPAADGKLLARLIAGASGVWFIWLISGKLPPPSGETIQQTLEIWQEQGFKQQRYPEDDVAEYLAARLREEDTVQIIDEGGPAPRALLLAQALPATPYLTYRQLLVNASQPIVQKMREDFIHRLQASPPRFVVDTHTVPRVTHAGAPYQFPEMESLLAQRYRKVVNRCNTVRCFLTIWEINEH